MMERWRSYIADGTFALSVPFDSPPGVPPSGSSEEGNKDLEDAVFWTSASSYWRLPDEERLMETLRRSGLVIFKGDLKYVHFSKYTMDASYMKAC